MSGKREIDPMQMCRICAVDVADDSGSHLLIENNQITELGGKFISCLGIQLMKDGYPERVCDYCQLQLNTFHAFVKKAKTTSNQFENMLQQIKMNEEDDSEDRVTNSEILSSNDLEFEASDDMHGKRTQQSIEVEFVVDSSRVDLRGDDENLDMSVTENNGDEDEYTIEYLEPEYMSTFVNEIAQNEEDDDEEEEEEEEDKSKESLAKNRPKRTYPYKCTTCNKRFVYKEVYEAHVRIHKGLPGYPCPHCPKTFNEKANFDYHMQDHTNYRPAKCHLCEKSFKNKQDLASHIRCHKDIRKYMCDVCGKRFRSQSHMTYHRYAHFEARNFACDQCEQKFKSPHILRTHRNTVHSNVFRYECEQCGRKFKRDHHLVAHRRTHNKAPGNRKPRKKKTENASAKLIDDASQTFEMVEMIKEESELDLSYADEEYETEFITD